MQMTTQVNDDVKFFFLHGIHGIKVFCLIRRKYFMILFASGFITSSHLRDFDLENVRV